MISGAVAAEAGFHRTPAQPTEGPASSQKTGETGTTLLQTNMEPEKQPRKEDSSLLKDPFSGSMFVWQSVAGLSAPPTQPGQDFDGVGGIHSARMASFSTLSCP